MKTIARRRGGKAESHDEKGRVVPSRHHESSGEDLAHAKHIGPVRGEHGKHTMARKPRKGGGRAAAASTGAERNPFSSAHHGSEPKGRHTMDD
jgi:hypothetical protein